MDLPLQISEQVLALAGQAEQGLGGGGLFCRDHRLRL